MKIDYDLHIHTEYCGHAAGMTVEKICRRADELGLRIIAITDHAYSPERPAPIDLIREQVAACKPRCRVLVGAEVDVDGRFTDGRLACDQLDGCDYIIAGFHYVPLLGHYPLSPQDVGMKDEEFLRVWESSLLGIVTNPKIDTLAHPARLLAMSADLDADFDYARTVFQQAARLSAQNGIAWEINELDGLRIRPEWHRRFADIYKDALDAGVKLVYGSDAHTPKNINKTDYVQTCLAYLPAGCLSAPEQILNR